MRDHRGTKNPKYRGGLFRRSSDDRLCIVTRDNKTVLFYRAVMEAHLRRELLPGEVVHHINGDCTDDRLENLRLTSQAEHMGEHRAELTAGIRRACVPQGWSHKYDRCRGCGTTERKHCARGLCEPCYRQEPDIRAKRLAYLRNYDAKRRAA